MGNKQAKRFERQTSSTSERSNSTGFCIAATPATSPGPKKQAEAAADEVPELIYFGAAGRGELIRLAFAAGGVNFKDTRLSQADWPFVKTDPTSAPGQAFQSIPVLKHNGQIVAQSRAIAAYAAEMGIWAQGRLGTGHALDVNGATEAMVLGAHADLQAAMYKCLFGDEAAKAAGMSALPAAATGILSGLERILDRKTCTGPFFFCEDGPTLADLAVYDLIESPFPGLRKLEIDLTPYRKVCAVAKAVSEDGRIAAYLKEAALGPPELIYFDAPGRGQLTRLAFAAAGVAFIDTRIKMDEWPKIKSDPESVPAQCFGSVPCLKHGDALIAQSTATAVYAAKKGIWKEGRLGATEAEQAVNRAMEMMVLSAHADASTAMYKCLFGTDDAKAKGKEALPAAAAGVLAGLERFLARKTCEGPYFFSQTGPTLADLAIYDMIESTFPGMKALGVDLAAYPKVRAVASAVAKDPKISAYLKSANVSTKSS